MFQDSLQQILYDYNSDWKTLKLSECYKRFANEKDVQHHKRTEHEESLKQIGIVSKPIIMAKIMNMKIFENFYNFSNEDFNYNMEEDKMSDDEEECYVSGIEEKKYSFWQVMWNFRKFLHSDDEFKCSNLKITITNKDAQKNDFKN